MPQTSLQITSEQIQGMQPIWMAYLQRITAVHERATAAREALIRVAVGAAMGAGDEAHAGNRGNAIDFVDSTGPAAVLAQLPKQTMVAYGHLCIGICGELSPVQHAKLLLTCRPYLPDYIQLCQEMLDPDGVPATLALQLRG